MMVSLILLLGSTRILFFFEKKAHFYVKGSPASKLSRFQIHYKETDRF